MLLVPGVLDVEGLQFDLLDLILDVHWSSLDLQYKDKSARRGVLTGGQRTTCRLSSLLYYTLGDFCNINHLTIVWLTLYKYMLGNISNKT